MADDTDPWAGLEAIKAISDRRKRAQAAALWLTHSGGTLGLRPQVLDQMHRAAIGAATAPYQPEEGELPSLSSMAEEAMPWLKPQTPQGGWQESLRSLGEGEGPSPFAQVVMHNLATGLPRTALALADIPYQAGQGAAQMLGLPQAAANVRRLATGEAAPAAPMAGPTMGGAARLGLPLAAGALGGPAAGILAATAVGLYDPVRQSIEQGDIAPLAKTLAERPEAALMPLYAKPIFTGLSAAGMRPAIEGVPAEAPQPAVPVDPARATAASAVLMQAKADLAARANKALRAEQPVRDAMRAADQAYAAMRMKTGTLEAFEEAAGRARAVVPLTKTKRAPLKPAIQGVPAEATPAPEVPAETPAEATAAQEEAPQEPQARAEGRPVDVQRLFPPTVQPPTVQPPTVQPPTEAPQRGPSYRPAEPTKGPGGEEMIQAEAAPEQTALVPTVRLFRGQKVGTGVLQPGEPLDPSITPYRVRWPGYVGRWFTDSPGRAGIYAENYKVNSLGEVLSVRVPEPDAAIFGRMSSPETTRNAFTGETMPASGRPGEFLVSQEMAERAGRASASRPKPSRLPITLGPAEEPPRSPLGRGASMPSVTMANGARYVGATHVEAVQAAIDAGHPLGDFTEARVGYGNATSETASPGYAHSIASELLANQLRPESGAETQPTRGPFYRGGPGGGRQGAVTLPTVGQMRDQFSAALAGVAAPVRKMFGRAPMEQAPQPQPGQPKPILIQPDETPPSNVFQLTPSEEKPGLGARYARTPMSPGTLLGPSDEVLKAMGLEPKSAIGRAVTAALGEEGGTNIAPILLRGKAMTFWAAKEMPRRIFGNDWKGLSDEDFIRMHRLAEGGTDTADLDWLQNTPAAGRIIDQYKQLASEAAKEAADPNGRIKGKLTRQNYVTHVWTGLPSYDTISKMLENRDVWNDLPEETRTKYIQVPRKGTAPHDWSLKDSINAYSAALAKEIVMDPVQRDVVRFIENRGVTGWAATDTQQNIVKDYVKYNILGGATGTDVEAGHTPGVRQALAAAEWAAGKLVGKTPGGNALSALVDKVNATAAFLIVHPVTTFTSHALTDMTRRFVERGFPGVTTEMAGGILKRLQLGIQGEKTQEFQDWQKRGIVSPAWNIGPGEDPYRGLTKLGRAFMIATTYMDDASKIATYTSLTDEFVKKGLALEDAKDLAQARTFMINNYTTILHMPPGMAGPGGQTLGFLQRPRMRFANDIVNWMKEGDPQKMLRGLGVVGALVLARSAGLDLFQRMHFMPTWTGGIMGGFIPAQISAAQTLYDPNRKTWIGRTADMQDVRELFGVMPKDERPPRRLTAR